MRVKVAAIILSKTHNDHECCPIQNINLRTTFCSLRMKFLLEKGADTRAYIDYFKKSFRITPGSEHALQVLFLK